MMGFDELWGAYLNFQMILNLVFKITLSKILRLSVLNNLKICFKKFIKLNFLMKKKK